MARLYFEAVPRLEEICVGFTAENGASIFAPVRQSGGNNSMQVVDVRLVDTYTIPRPLAGLLYTIPNHIDQLVSFYTEDHKDVERLYEERGLYDNRRLSELRGRTYRFRHDYATFWDVEWYVSKSLQNSGLCSFQQTLNHTTFQETGLSIRAHG